MDSSTRMGSPADEGVAAARTKSQRGGDYGGPKRVVAGIYEMNTQESNLCSANNGGSTECLRVERISTKLRQGPSAGQEDPCQTMSSIIQKRKNYSLPSLSNVFTLAASR
jgi:hypothetical protein